MRVRFLPPLPFKTNAYDTQIICFFYAFHLFSYIITIKKRVRTDTKYASLFELQFFCCRVGCRVLNTILVPTPSLENDYFVS